jgi:TPR repeat protein
MDFRHRPTGGMRRTMRTPTSRRPWRPMALALLLTAGSATVLPGAWAQDAGDPGSGHCGQALSDPASDLSVAHAAQQPAGLVTCGMGYLAAKCGDYRTANVIFDKCIAKGYAGAMIWKAHLYENGHGVPRDLARAAALFRQAAENGDEQYAALGKLHYASALHEGRGVPRDEAEARRWFEAAAAQGSEDAREFLRTGHHTASRDAFGRGVGEAPGDASLSQRMLRKVEAALPAGRTGLQAFGAGAALLGLLGLGAWRQMRPRRPTPPAPR